MGLGGLQGFVAIWALGPGPGPGPGPRARVPPHGMRVRGLVYIYTSVYLCIYMHRVKCNRVECYRVKCNRDCDLEQ